MVKNTKGGNHKNQARKDSYSHSSSKTRISNDPNELYATVSKIYGGKLCDVITSNGDSLSCTIRGKFSGKFKHSNLLSINSFVLVGIHDWATDKSKCDLLHIYSNLHADFISDNYFNTYQSSQHTLPLPSSLPIEQEQEPDIDQDIDFISI